MGRRRELATLTKLLDENANVKRSVLIEGEAGIGKTRLLAEFLEQARRAGVAVLQGVCYQVEEAGPYSPFFQILSQLRLSGLVPDHVLHSSAAAALAGQQWGRLTEDAGSRRARFLREVGDSILQPVASTPTIICIEDLQWADLGSLLLLNTLLDVQPRSLLLVCTARIGETSGAEARQLLLRIEQKSQTLVLRGLTRAETGDFAKRMVGMGFLTTQELADVRSLTKGNPLFLGEVIQHLQEQGSLDRHSLRQAIQRARMPAGLAHIIDLRLRTLPEAVRRTLSVCSTIGVEFSAMLAGEVVAMSQGAVEDQLELCIQKGFLQPLDAIPSGGYRFIHPLFQNRLYHLIQPAERRRLHRQIARAAERTGLAAGELARHYALGSRPGDSRALAACREAAERAERLLAYETAARFWEFALQCTSPRSRRAKAELYRRLGWALWAANNWTRATGAWTEALRLFESLKDWGQVGQVALALGETYRFRQELAESARWLELALEHLPEGAQDQQRAMALLGSIRCLDRDQKPGLQLLKRASETTDATERDPIVAYWLSFGFLVSGDPPRAREIAKEGLAAATQLGNSKAISLLAGSLLHHDLAHLNITSARSNGRLVRDAAHTADASTLTRSLLCRALLLGYTGDWQQVVKLCEDWMAQVRLAGRFQVATARLIWADATLALGRPAAALNEMQRALPDLEQMRPLASLHLARALLALGEDQAADAIAREYAPVVYSNPRYATSRAVLGDVVARLDVPELWQPCIDSLAGEARPMLLPYSPVSVRRVLGRLMARMRRWPEAFDHFEAALGQLSQGEARWEFAQTCLNYAAARRARRRRGDVRKAEALDLEATAILDACGAEYQTYPPSPSLEGARFGLTGRELEVLALLAEGRRNQEIAEELFVSPSTVNRHVENILAKIGARSRTEAVILALREGLAAPIKRSADEHARLETDGWLPQIAN